jgi:chromosome segregation ATPase
MKKKHLEALRSARQASYQAMAKAKQAEAKAKQLEGSLNVTAGNLSQVAEAFNRRITTLEKDIEELSQLVDALIERNRPKPEECEHRWYFISAHGQGSVFQYQCYQCNTQKEVMAHDLEKDSQ